MIILKQQIVKQMSTQERKDFQEDVPRKKKQQIESKSIRKSRKVDQIPRQKEQYIGKKQHNENIKETKEKQEIKEKQEKLTSYFNLGIKQSSNNSLKNLPPTDIQFKLLNLEEELKTKNQTIENLKKENIVQHYKYGQLYNDKKNYSAKVKQTVITTLKRLAEMKRAEKNAIDPRLGYYKDNCFVQGQQILTIRKKIRQKQQILQKIEGQKISKKNEQQYQRIQFSLQFVKEQLQELNQQLKKKQSQINLYKERIKLADKEAVSKYSVEKWPLVKGRYQTLQMLGSGGFGEVYKCFDLQINDYVALKVNKFATAEKEHREQFMKHVNRQIKTQQSLNHANIVKFIDLIETTENSMTFVLQYCSGPQLSKYLKKKKTLQEKEAKAITKQIINGLYYLYNLQTRIIHYDLKPANIIFHNGVVKILDFGLCKLMDNEDTRMELTSQGVGTYWYLPPETFEEYAPTVSSKVDIWSAGVIFYEMLYGKRPFGHGLSQKKIINEGIILKATNVEFPPNTKQLRVSENAKQFISACLKYKPEERMTPQEAYSHPYFHR